MSAIFGERLIFGLHNGPDIELGVFGDELFRFMLAWSLRQSDRFPQLGMIA